MSQPPTTRPAALQPDTLDWLLQPDDANPGVRYFALRDLLDRPPTDPDVQAARAAVMVSGPVPIILAHQQPEGYWLKPGGGYGKYQGTAWQIMFLAELGADPADARVQHGCEYLLSHAIADNGGFSCNQNAAPAGVIPCLTGNLLYALIRLGRLDDPRVQGAIDWQARAITGDLPIRYFRSTTSGPDCACGINGGLPCAWGATKAVQALAAIPPGQRTPLIQRALDQGADLLLRYDLATAAYPTAGAVSAAWFKLGFPLSYWSDILETLTVLLRLGHAGHPHVRRAVDWLYGKQDAQGRWPLENALNSRMWANIERKGKPSKWITLRGLRAIKLAQPALDPV